MLQETVQQLAESNNATNWIQAISGLASAIAAIFSARIAYVLLQQIKLQKKQIALSQRQFESQENWNRINASFTYFSDEYYSKIYDVMQTELTAIGVDVVKDGILPASVLPKLLKPPEPKYEAARKSVIRVLNFLEAYAIAAQTTPPVMDINVAKELYGIDVVHWYNYFSEFIKKSQGDRHEAAYQYLKKLRDEWKDYTQKHVSVSPDDKSLSEKKP